MQYDKYGEVVNGKDTYSAIAERMVSHVPILIGWTDERGTHFDIAFTYSPEFYGANYQGGIKSNDIFVSVMRLGAFGFKRNQELHPGYVMEKLGSVGITAEKLTELINGIIAELK